MVAELSVVGRPLGRIEGESKVTGAALYAADTVQPGQLWGKILRSPLPHARILNVDVSAARRLPGVHAVLAGSDLPRVLVGQKVQDMPLLARDRVRFVGDRVAAVAAVDADTADEALSLIRVEYEDLPAVFDAEEAMRPGAPVLHPDLKSYAGLDWELPDVPNLEARYVHDRGDLAEGLRKADLVIEHTFRTALMHQGYIEPQACVVALEPDGSANVWLSNKTPFRTRDMIADALDMPREGVVLHHVPVGGDFGGKGGVQNAPLAYFLARASGHPVAIVNSYAEELTALNPRHPTIVKLKTGVMRDGTLVARDGLVIYDRGAYAAHNVAPNGILNGVFKLGGTYRIPNARVEGLAVYTNHVPCGYMRAPGQPQVIFAVEAHMDLVAEALGMDPLEFRLKNVLLEGEKPVVDVTWQNIQARAVLERAAEAIGWGTPKPPNVGRGLALSERGIGGGESHVEIAVGADGRVSVHTGVPDTGTGIYTILQQVVAEVVGVPLDTIDVGALDTAHSPIDPGTGGSKTTHITGRAALDAAQVLRARLNDVAAARLGVEPEQVEIDGGQARADGQAVELATLAREAEARGEPLRVRGIYKGTVPQIVSFVAQAAEVEVDPDTGQVKVRRIASAHDTGMILNPLGYQGQVDGGVVQGVGSALMEGSAIEDGRVVAANLGDYKLATMADIPELITVHVQSPEGPAPFGGKSIGEEPFVPVAGAIANAVRDATGVHVHAIPIQPETVLRGLRAKQEDA
ncbi:MAG TPA: xanthine dehydrogenase family protein molybdopterin-binding subunit [Chloroflexota bacterium]